MDVVYARCCGLDVHKKRVVACRIVPGPDGRPAKEIRTFGTMTDDLLALADWLTTAQVTHVAMESTGVFWQPMWNLLVGSFALLLANAQHIKAVPGRKTDVRDCEWIADLLRHGLLRASFVPDRAQRELRELTRSRTSLVRERSTEVHRLQQTLEGANSKLAAVATDNIGHHGAVRAADPRRPGGGERRSSSPGRARQGPDAGAHSGPGAGAGRTVRGPSPRFLVAQQLAHIDFLFHFHLLDAAIERVSGEVTARLQPHAAMIDRLINRLINRLDTIPGVGRWTAEVLRAELGTAMTRFPSARHLASWAGMCPGNHESAGKRRSGRRRKGNAWLRAALVAAGQAAGRTKRTSLGAQERRLAARRGAKRAAVAVGHSILGIASHLLQRATTYADLGVAYFDERDRRAVERRLIRRLEALGYTVLLESAVA